MRVHREEGPLVLSCPPSASRERIRFSALAAALLTGEEETAVKHTSGSRARISVMKNGLDELASSPAPEASTPPWTYAAILLPS